MSIVYCLVLFGVFVALLAVTWDAVRSVSRPPEWSRPAHQEVADGFVERRQQSLPYVGRERRVAATADAPVEAGAERERLRA